MKKVLILYTELAGYTVSCIRHFVETTGHEVMLVRWPVNAEAPFQFEFDDRIKVIERRSLDRDRLLQLAKTFSPDVILCSGWMDKDYVAVCRFFRKSIPVVLLMDNKWVGSWKQQVARFAGRITILRTFSHAWVPGKRQAEYASRLGFRDTNIMTGFYAADVSSFSEVWERRRARNSNRINKRFVYAARYYEFKGIRELWEAFSRFHEHNKEWKLICIGTGDIEPVQKEGIQHLGFLQPSDLVKVMEEGGVYILPSRVEPWGVSLQEFTAAGFPAIVSDQVGSADVFLKDGVNGFMFESGSVDSLLQAMNHIAELSEERWMRMEELSHELGASITPETWKQQLTGLLTTSGAY